MLCKLFLDIKFSILLEMLQKTSILILFYI